MIQFRKEQIGEVIERLFLSKISFRLDGFLDCDFEATVGDDTNGWEDIPNHEKIDSSDIAQVISLLAYNARQIYPDSEFAKWYDELVAFQKLKQMVIDGELVFYPENASVSTGVLSFETQD